MGEIDILQQDEAFRWVCRYSGKHQDVSSRVRGTFIIIRSYRECNKRKKQTWRLITMQSSDALFEWSDAGREKGVVSCRHV